MMREPKTVPIPINIQKLLCKQEIFSYLPAPDPATPTVAAPAPMNLAAVSISRLATETESGLQKCQ